MMGKDGNRGRAVISLYACIACIGCLVLLQAPLFFSNNYWTMHTIEVARTSQTKATATDPFAEEVPVNDTAAVEEFDRVEYNLTESGTSASESLEVERDDASDVMDLEAPSVSNPKDAAVVVQWQGLKALEKSLERFWLGNMLCETIQEIRANASNSELPVIVNATFNCNELFSYSYMGSGNYVWLMYSMRLAAQKLKHVDLYLACDDAEETKHKLIVPWFTGRFYARNDDDEFQTLSVPSVCGSYVVAPVVPIYNSIQRDLRRMAIGLVGIPSPDHPSAAFARTHLFRKDQDDSSSLMQLSDPAEGDIPPFPNSEFLLDDVVIHFRCGDLMESENPAYGIMKFSSYAYHISPEARSIGIVTQPFDDKDTIQTRIEDTKGMQRARSRTVVTSFVAYIRLRFPNARIQIHTGPKETIALAFARMVMANQTISALSSFSVFPTIATFGTGYVLKPDNPKAPSWWLLSPRIDEIANNVVLFEDVPPLMAPQIKTLWETTGAQDILDWFWNDHLTVECMLQCQIDRNDTSVYVQPVWNTTEEPSS
jgi:hypothetical protein